MHTDLVTIVLIQHCRPPLTNGHDYNSAADAKNLSSSPLNTVNGTTSSEDAPAPVTNGVQEMSLNQSQSSAELVPSVSASLSTGDPLALTSGEPATDHASEQVVDSVAVKATSANADFTPAVVQAPTSDLREETHPTDSQRTVEMKEQKQSEDLLGTSITTNSAPSVETANADAQSESLPPIASSDPQPELEKAPQTSTAEIASAAAAPETAATTKIASEQLPHHPPVPVPEGSAPEVPLDPAPTAVPQADGAGSISGTQDTSQDQEMPDAPSPPAKVAREREDDDDEMSEGPLAKRTKTADISPSSDFKKPERPAETAEEDESQAAESQVGSTPMTKPQQKHLLKTVGNVKRITAAKMFTAPVDYVAMNLPNYPSIVTKPMDLRTLEDNLRADKYKTMEAAVADFNQIVENSKLFNGVEHPVTNNAYVMKSSFDKAMEKMPGPAITEVSASDRKKKATEPGPVKIPPPRRESRSSLPGSARSPAIAASPQTFALSPEGVPLIRRDSTLDGRPKREIHRPAPRDLPYSNQKPKKKKFQWELKFCEKVLTELSKPKYQGLSYPFMAPVDPVALNIPTYHSIVRKPMDFGTMKQKLDRGEYENAKDFEADARLVFQNCYKFNPPGDIIHNTGKDFEKVFDAEWAKKREWLENNTPTSGPQSPGTSPDPVESEEEEEEEEEEEDEEEDQSVELLKLQQHITALSKQVEAIQQKKKKSPPAQTKKSKSKPAKKESKKAAPAAPAKAEKKAAPKAKKEKVPYVTYEQKQDISMRINSLSESKMATALKIIRDNMPNLKVFPIRFLWIILPLYRTLTFGKYRAFKMTRSSLTLTSCPTRCCTSF